MTRSPTLRPATTGDADYIAGAEAVPEIARFILPWPAAEHATRMAESTFGYYVCEDEAGAPVGYAILRGIGEPNRSIELMRLAATERDRGIGSALLSMITREAFENLDAHRFWLDVFPENDRARHVYRRFGFIEEGTMREAYLWNGEFRSTIIMSMLAPEYADLGRGSS
jgi:RimJ/RimL family protein N-acetyltransferase